MLDDSWRSASGKGHDSNIRGSKGAVAERARSSKREARENPKGHVAHKEAANPGHSSHPWTEKKTRTKMHFVSKLKRHVRKEEANDDDDDDDGPEGCCGK